jgi:hypothetical protein
MTSKVHGAGLQHFYKFEKGNKIHDISLLVNILMIFLYCCFSLESVDCHHIVVNVIIMAFKDMTSGSPPAE